MERPTVNGEYKYGYHYTTSRRGLSPTAAGGEGADGGVPPRDPPGPMRETRRGTGLDRLEDDGVPLKLTPPRPLILPALPDLPRPMGVAVPLGMAICGMIGVALDSFMYSQPNHVA